MVRIGGSTEKGAHIKESDYFTPQVGLLPMSVIQNILQQRERHSAGPTIYRRQIIMYHHSTTLTLLIRPTYIDRNISKLFLFFKGEFRVDRDGAPAMLNCLMYKMSYYRFGEVFTEGSKPAGWDRLEIL